MILKSSENEVEWLNQHFHNHNSGIKHVALKSRKSLIIEEPETNLHPDFQVKFADMILDFMNESDWHVIIETHSEYIIRSVQYKVAENNNYEENITILNFGSKKTHGKVKNIDIKKDGSLSNNFYPGFFNISNELQQKLLKVSNLSNN